VLVGLGIVSAAWSVDGHLTLERTFTIAALFTAGYGIATLGNRPQAAARMILGSVLAGAVAVALASLVAVVFVRHEAIQPATDGAGWRFQGVGQNPNTVPMLLAVTYPLALGGVLSTSGRKRWLLGAAFLLMAGEVSVSGSRGALIAGTAGAIVVAVALGGTWRRRGILVAAMLVLAAACVGANKLQGSPAPVVATGATGSGQVQSTRGIDGETVFRLEDELGHPPLGAYRPPVPRTFLGSSGRAQAWVGAFKQGAQRPVDGYGFGMEEKVFVDRFYAFEGGFVENSYLSMFLQLGAIGVAAFIGLILFLGRDGMRACRASSIETRAPAAAAAGALLAGVTVGMTQSGLLAVGNIASVGLWLSVLCLPTLARTARR
jgi:hypothetical protein